MKRFLTIIFLGMMCISFVACGENGADESGLNKNENAAEENNSDSDIKIEDIDWVVDNVIIDGDRRVGLSYTNNTQYTISELEIKFTQRDDVTEEQLAVFDDFINENSSYLSEEDKADIYIWCDNEKMSDPGETVDPVPCDINGFYYVQNMEQYEIMEPDIATISYIGTDNKCYEVYYDFKNNSYSKSSQGGIDAQQWSDSEMASLLPKPDFRMVEVTSDIDTLFSFTAYGASYDEYSAYVDICEESEFTNEDYRYDDWCRAYNADNYELYIYYDADDEQIECLISPPDEN